MADGPQQQGRHEARQGPGEQGHRQQKRQVSQHGGVAQGNQGRRHLADVVARRAADGHAVYRQTRQTGQLLYRGYDVKDLINGSRGSRFAFEEAGYLLLFGQLPTPEQLERFLSEVGCL